MTNLQALPVPRPPALRRHDQDDAAGDGVRRSALVAGPALFGVAVLAAAGNFGAVQRLVTDGNATRTAIDIMAAQTTFSLGIATLVVVAALDVVVAMALRAFFAPVHHHLASLAAWLRVSYAAICCCSRAARNRGAHSQGEAGAHPCTTDCFAAGGMAPRRCARRAANPSAEQRG